MKILSFIEISSSWRLQEVLTTDGFSDARSRPSWFKRVVKSGAGLHCVWCLRKEWHFEHLNWFAQQFGSAVKPSISAIRVSHRERERERVAELEKADCGEGERKRMEDLDLTVTRDEDFELRAWSLKIFWIMDCGANLKAFEMTIMSSTWETCSCWLV